MTVPSGSFPGLLILWLLLWFPTAALAQTLSAGIEIRVNYDDLSSSAHFGDSVGLSGDLFAVGAPRQTDMIGYQAGIVGLFQYQMETPAWNYWGMVEPPDPKADDHFGSALAFRGDWLLVGAPSYAEMAGQFAVGEAYIFYIDEESETTDSVSTLQPQFSNNFDRWGSSLALGLSYAFVGSEATDRMENNAGEVQVFGRMGMGLDATWEYREMLTGMDLMNHRFGSAIATTPDGSRVIVGADGNGDIGGWAFVFDFEVRAKYFEFTVQYGLPDGLGAAGDNFGTSVAISEDGLTAVVGADTADGGKGKAWVISLPALSFFSGARHAAHPTLPALPAPVALVDPEGEVGEQFGSSVAISGDVISVGAEANNDEGVNSGAVFLFGRNVGGPDNWGLIEQVNPSDASESDRYGSVLALDGDHLAVGAPLWSDPQHIYTEGAAYVTQLPEPNGILLAGFALATLGWCRVSRERRGSAAAWA